MHFPRSHRFSNVEVSAAPYDPNFGVFHNGQISPRADVLNADDEAFQIARNVYETGSFNVPLWDAMWGSLVPSDFTLADSAMPGGEWPFHC